MTQRPVQDPQGTTQAYLDMEQGLVSSGRSDYTPVFLSITASGNTELVAAVTAQRIRVIWLVVTNDGGSKIAFHFESSTTAISGNHALASDGGGYTISCTPSFYCQTAVGEALNANLSGAGTVEVEAGYILV